MHSDRLPPATNKTPCTPGNHGAKTTPPSNLEAMLARVGGNTALLAEVVAVFSGEVDKHRARMKKALARGDAADIARLAHGFKGVLGTMEAKEAHQIALDLEQAAKEEQFHEAEFLFNKLVAHIESLAAYFNCEKKGSSTNDDCHE